MTAFSTSKPPILPLRHMACLGLAAVLLVTYYFICRSPIHGGADAYWHYLMVAYAYENPGLYLNHWGKPLFILLASPFSFLGIYGVYAYNLLAALASSYLSVRIADGLGIKSLFYLLISLICAPIFLMMATSSMTEMTFALVLMLGLRLFQLNRFCLGSVVFSLLPFCRTEGLPVLLVLSVYLIYVKRYRAIPFLTLGFIVYALIGLLWYYHDFWWFFHQNPYSLFSAEKYGSGGFWHYFICAPAIFGPIMLFAAVVYLKEEWVFLLRKSRSLELLILLLFCAYFFMHVFFWTFGMGASAGLLRLMAPIIPLLAILSARGMDIMKDRNAITKWSETAIIASIIILPVFTPLLTNNSAPKLSHRAAEWLLAHDEGQQVIYSRPEIVHYLGADPQGETRYHKLEQKEESLASLGPGDLLVWDSEIAQNDGKIFYHELKVDGRFSEIQIFEEEEPFEIYTYGEEEDKELMLPHFRVSIFRRNVTQ